MVLSISVLVDSGASKHLLDPVLIPGLHGRHYSFFESPHKIITAEKHVLEGIPTGTIHDTAADISGTKRMVAFPAIVVPGLGTNVLLLHRVVETDNDDM